MNIQNVAFLSTLYVWKYDNDWNGAKILFSVQRQTTVS